MNRTNWTLVFVAAVALQLILLAAVPAKRLIALTTGQRVLLKIAPVDPYNPFSGYHMRINYAISQPEVRPSPDVMPDGPVYVVLVEGADGVWNATAVLSAYPRQVPHGAVVIKGRNRYRRIEYGIESFYVPEDKRREIEADLRFGREEAFAEVIIGPDGQPMLLRLIVGDRSYDY